MPTYDYVCENLKCVAHDYLVEIFHSMSDETEHVCLKCKRSLKKCISGGYDVIVKHGTLAKSREEDHLKKVKDPERAEKSRKKHFGSEAIGSSKEDGYRQGSPVGLKGHVKGRALGGQVKEIDKAEFIKAAAKDDYIVEKAQEALKKAERKKK